MDELRALRVYHAGHDPLQRARERSLSSQEGIEIALATPLEWSGEMPLTGPDVAEPFEVIRLAVDRAGDVNRHRYAEPQRPREIIERLRPNILDIHEEPFSVAAHQWLEAAPPDLPVVMYAAQNVDKRYPPPFTYYERRAFERVSAIYPCSRQAAAVVRGKGFAGLIDVLDLGFDSDIFFRGGQAVEDDELVLAFVGRLVPEKGVTDAVRILAAVQRVRRARLIVVGEGPERGRALDLASALGVADHVEIHSWRQPSELGVLYRRSHVVLVPSVPTTTWTEQFGRVIVEAQASGAVVVGYATGAIPEVAGSAAVLVRPGDVRALVDAVLWLARDAAAFASKRAAGLRLSRARTWKSIAARHASLYRRVADGRIERRHLPRSPRTRRGIARAEFGESAQTTAGMRPFALPVLRTGGVAAAALARLIDAFAELDAPFRIRRHFRKLERC